MHDLFSNCLLLAARSRLDNLSQPFKGHAAGVDRGDVTRALAILTVAVVLAWLLSRLRAVQEQQRGYNSPWRLFFSLCRAHELPWSQRWLLWRLARAAVETAGPAVPGTAVVRGCRPGAGVAQPRRAS